MAPGSAATGGSLTDVSIRSAAFGANVAVTACAEPIVTAHEPPVHAPLQPVRSEPPAGVAVSVTTVPETNAVAHVVGQAMPAGELETDPVPAPASVTVSMYEGGAALNERGTSGAGSYIALPDCDAVIVQVPAATSVTVVSDTVQPPVALKLTGRPDDAVALTVNGGSVDVLSGRGSNVIVCARRRLKTAVQAWSASIVTAPVAHAGSPLQPAKYEPAAGAGVSVTTVPSVNWAAQLGPHAIPAGALVTPPLPVPVSPTVIVKRRGTSGLRATTTVASARPYTIVSPPDEKTIDRTPCVVRPGVSPVSWSRIFRRLPSTVLQKRIVASSPLDASAAPSGETASVTIVAVCPTSGDPTAVPSATRRLTMLAPALLVWLGFTPAASVSPSSEKASAVTYCPYCSVVRGVRLIVSQIWTCLPSPMMAARRVRSAETVRRFPPVLGSWAKSETEPSIRLHSWIELSEELLGYEATVWPSATTARLRRPGIGFPEGIWSRLPLEALRAASVQVQHTLADTSVWPSGESKIADCPRSGMVRARLPVGASQSLSAFGPRGSVCPVMVSLAAATVASSGVSATFQMKPE